MKITLSRNEVKMLEKVVVVMGTEKEVHENLQKQLLTGEAVELEDGSLQLNLSEEFFEVATNVLRKVVPVVMTFASTIKNMFGDVMSEFKKLDAYNASASRTYFDADHNEMYRFTASADIVVADGYELNDVDYGKIMAYFNSTIKDFSVKFANTDFYKALLIKRESLATELEKRNLTIQGDDNHLIILKDGVWLAEISTR